MSLLLRKITFPVQQIKWSYVPLMMVYFSVGFSGLSAVTNTLFMKNDIALGPSEQISLTVWIMLPWSIKMVFGTLVDGIKIFGNNRKSYIYLGNIMIALGAIGMVDHASSRYLINFLESEYSGLLLTGLISTIGVVIADIVADTMAIEITDDQKELGVIQVLSRLSLSIGGVLAAAVTGYLAANFSSHIVFGMQLICPALAILATLFTRVQFQTPTTSLNKPILFGGIAFGCFSLFSGVLLENYGQVIVFVFSLIVLTVMLKNIISDMDQNKKQIFILSMLALFLFRVVPGVGPAGLWYFIDEHGFDASFLGTLRLIGSVTSLLVLWLLAERIAESSLFSVMLVLIVLTTIFSLPEIMIYYNVHEYLGITAKNLSLGDTAVDSPIVNLSMVPLGVLIAKNAPVHQKAVYTSLTASLMNISLVGGEILTKFLNDIYQVTRTDFSKLGQLMIASLILSTILSVLGLIFLRWRKVS